jgi:hypothetical protein
MEDAHSDNYNHHAKVGLLGLHKGIRVRRWLLLGSEPHQIACARYHRGRAGVGLFCREIKDLLGVCERVSVNAYGFISNLLLYLT